MFRQKILYPFHWGKQINFQVNLSLGIKKRNLHAFFSLYFCSKTLKKYLNFTLVVCFMVVDIASIQIDASWKNVLAAEFAKPYFAHIKEFLLQEKEAGHIVYPK